jgi:diguanylate cyclase (GGDEF)-like protein
MHREAPEPSISRLRAAAGLPLSEGLLPAIHRFLSGRSTGQFALGSLALVAGIGAIDFVTGYELSFSIFYLIPAAIASWYGGRQLGVPICLVAASTWLLVDLTSGHEYSQIAIPIWNAVVRLGFFVIVGDLLCRLRHALEIQASLARHDSLTGLMNSTAFVQRCDTICKLAVRHAHSMVLAYIDLDHFKNINDRLGHDVGDRVLKAVALELVKRLRTSDLVARMGGDEFAVLLPETDLAGARIVFPALRETLVEVAARSGWPVGFSIGVVAFQAPPSTIEEAIRCADQLMYKVKGGGKDHVLFEEYDPSPA